MDSVLCDELLQEIFHRLPPSSLPSISLVSRRWLFLLRSSTTALSIRIPYRNPSSSSLSSPPPTTTTLSLSSILSHYPLLSTLAVLSIQDDDSTISGGGHPSSDPLLLAVATSPCSGRLSHLRFLPISLVSPSALRSSSTSFTRLTTLHLPSPHPLSFRWLASFPSLKSLSLVHSPSKRPHRLAIQEPQQECDHDDDDDGGGPLLVLPLETLSISGIRAADRGASWLWRRCGNLRRLQLRACEATGDVPSSPSFPLCLRGLLSLELRTCRSIADRILLHAADHCASLTSLLLYDGGSRNALLRFILQRGAGLRVLDLRLPLDLDNEHLAAMAADPLGPGLVALRLQSCCLITGNGLRSLARAAAGASIEELGLVNCDVVEREPGLLSFLGQSMRRLRRVDLSHNETVGDKEVRAMLASCRNLVDIRLRGCRGLTDATLRSLLKCCGERLVAVDISRCPGISVDGIEILVLNTLRLDLIMVEDHKLSEAARASISRKGIKLG